MNLTINEITNLINTWNSWYLIEHDSYLSSEWSENILELTLEGFDATALAPELLEDLKEYTDFIDTDRKNRFHIKFVFDAFDHQAREVFEALQPVLEKASGCPVVISNSMEFIRDDIYQDPALKRLMDTASSHREEPGEDREDEKESLTGEAHYPPAGEDSDSSGRFALEIRGNVEKGLSVTVKEAFFNQEEFPKLDIFLEASRMYGSIEMNFQPPKGVAGTSPFECADAVEARGVSDILGEVTDFRPRLVKDNILETGAMPDELAAAITYYRYRDQFSLFKNPRAGILRLKRGEDISSTRESLQRSCQMVLFLLMAGSLLLIWWLKNRGN